MSNRFDAKDPDEVELYAVNFAGRLGSETITADSGVVTITTADGADASSLKSGAATINGTSLEQMVTGGTDGTDYLIRFQITTSGGRTLVDVKRLPVKTATVA